MSEVTTTFGIDLGTTYSCISYLKDGHPTVCLNLEGDSTTPSVVRLLMEEEAPVVGKTAKDTSMIYPDDTVQFVKSKIGKVESFEIGDSDNRRSVTPVNVSAEILKKLAADAEAYTGMPVKDVVVTVPAYFGTVERDATRKAGELAGLHVVRLVEEPTAAAFYYLCERDEADATVCVFDLGGGTFDVTTIKKEGSDINVITTEGNHDLGGKNWDAELINYVESKFREETNLSEDEELDSEFLQELQIKCEEAKKQLTSAPSASIALKIDKNHKANISVTREEFDDITSTLLQTAIDLTKKVFEETERKGEKINKILLVGGSSKMPQVDEALKLEFGDKVEEILKNDPDQSVSKGACIYCAWSMLNETNEGDTYEIISSVDENKGEEEVITVAISGKEVNEETGETIITIVGSNGETRETIIPALPGGMKDMVIKTVATKSFGIASLAKGQPVITNLIKKDQVLPAVYEQAFGTNIDNQTDVNIELFQSEIKEDSFEPQYGTKIGESCLTGIPDGLPMGSPVTIRIELNTEGVIVITGSYNGVPLDGQLNTSFAEGVANQ